MMDTVLFIIQWLIAPVAAFVWMMHVKVSRHDTDIAVLQERMENRTHFMPAGLLQSQLDTLEPPKEGIKLDSSLPIKQMIDQLKTYLNEY